MRDVFAGVVALLLFLFALSLATALQSYRRRRQRARDSERALGRTIITEIPTDEHLVLFSEDDKRFYYGERNIDKDLITAVRLLINGAPLATYTSRRARPSGRQQAHTGAAGETSRLPADQPPGSTASIAVDDRPEGIARDRWDVAIDTLAGPTLVPCGAVRERVSQELARAVFNAVKQELERRDN